MAMMATADNNDDDNSSRKAMTAVFVEKPVDETSERIEALFRRANQVGMSICCGYQRRFDPSCKKIHML